MDNIFATDVDLTANIELSLQLSDSMDIKNDTLREMVEGWFKLEIVDRIGPNPDPYTGGNLQARIVLADLNNLPDREGDGIEDVDRVDLLIKAVDTNYETKERQETTQEVAVIIEDINDNPPRWPEGEDFSAELLEVEETDVVDDSTESQREIQRFRVVDPDRGTTFHFSLR